jgi:putative membrane protein
MSSLLRDFLVRWVVNVIGVLAATQIVPGIAVSSWPGLLVAALLLGLLNAFVRPLLTLLSLPLVVLTLGLFLWVINAALLSLVAWLVKPFTISSFWSALGGAAVISIISWVAHAFLGGKDGRQGPPAGGQPTVRGERRGPPEGQGPVIDV